MQVTANVVFRRLVLLGTPLTLALLETFHPRSSGQMPAFDSLLPRADWWLTLHLLQLPLFGLIALAVYLLVNGLRGPAATISRTAIALFLVFFSAYDAIAGITTGILLRDARGLTADQQDVIRQAIERLLSSPFTGNVSAAVIAVFALGALGWIVAVIAAAVALDRAGAPSPSVIFIALSLFGPHNFPFGTIAMAFFFLGAAWLEFAPRRPVHRAEVPAPDV